jgi:protocatechuate 3,4-dioxygenase beta subunit
MSTQDEHSRRRFLIATALAAAGAGLGDLAAAQELSPTPECKDAHEPTRAQTEGPFYKPRSPERADLREPGLGGRMVELSGFVLTRACKPVARALVDLWHADDKGEYDNRGNRGRGHVLTDEQGRYRFRTIEPALYPGRTRHYHVKVINDGRALLTTQLYFPADEAANKRDGLYRPELLMKVAQAGGKGLDARFDFVLDMR